MFAFLNRLYPFDFSIKRISFNAWIAFLIVFFILFCLAPFNMDALPVLKRLKVALSFASVCVLVIYPLDIILSRVFLRFYNEKTWTVGKQICTTFFVLCGISIGNTIMSHYMFGNPMNPSTFFAFFLYVAMIGVFPIAIGTIFTQYVYQKKFVALANIANVNLANEKQKSVSFAATKSQSESEITLIGQNANESIRLNVSSLLYFEAADNYVEIHFYKEIKKKVLFRASLSFLLDQLKENEEMVKCHRSYVVNKTAIAKTTGSAQGLSLILNNADKPIPVSRTLSKMFMNN